MRISSHLPPSRCNFVRRRRLPKHAAKCGGFDSPQQTSWNLRYREKHGEATLPVSEGTTLRGKDKVEGSLEQQQAKLQGTPLCVEAGGGNPPPPSNFPQPWRKCPAMRLFKSAIEPPRIIWKVWKWPDSLLTPSLK